MERIKYLIKKLNQELNDCRLIIRYKNLSFILFYYDLKVETIFN